MWCRSKTGNKALLRRQKRGRPLWSIEQQLFALAALPLVLQDIVIATADAYGELLGPLFERQAQIERESAATRSLQQVDRIIIADGLKKLKAQLIEQIEQGHDSPEL
jgi:hypothetical protein